MLTDPINDGPALLQQKCLPENIVRVAFNLLCQKIANDKTKEAGQGLRRNWICLQSPCVLRPEVHDLSTSTSSADVARSNVLDSTSVSLHKASECMPHGDDDQSVSRCIEDFRAILKCAPSFTSEGSRIDARPLLFEHATVRQTEERDVPDWRSLRQHS